MNKPLTECKPIDLLNSLRSDVCPACGGFKRYAQTLCGKQYYSLPQPMRKCLYARFGKGYEQAFNEAMKFLDVLEISLPDLSRTNHQSPATSGQSPTKGACND